MAQHLETIKAQGEGMKGKGKGGTKTGRKWGVRNPCVLIRGEAGVYRGLVRAGGEAGSTWARQAMDF